MLDNKHVFSVWWEIEIKGIKLDAWRKNHITEITTDRSVDGFDTMTLRINDPNYDFISDDLYVEDVPIVYYQGFRMDPDANMQTFQGYIASIDIDFPEDGMPTMEVYCVDKSHLMNRVKNSRSWENTKSVDVARWFAEQYGFNFYADTDYPYITQDSISQSNQTDIEFLQGLAQDEIQPHICKLVGDTLFYIRLGLMSTPKRSLSYRQYPYEIKSFKPQINKETKEIEVKYIDIMAHSKTVDFGVTQMVKGAQANSSYPISTSDVPFGSVPYHESNLGNNNSNVNTNLPIDNDTTTNENAEMTGTTTE